MVGVRGPMPGKAMHGHGCPCDGCAHSSDRFIAYAEEHGTEPEECRDCLALVDETTDDGYCPDCAADLDPETLADPPVDASDFSNPAPVPGGEPF